MEKRKRNFGLLLLGIILVSLIGVGSIYALFRHLTPLIENKFTIANKSTELVEPVYEMRGSTLHKEPMVINTGTASCLVRLKVVIDPEEIFASSVVSEPSETDKQNLLDNGYKFWVDFQNTWELADDGYWYYKGVLNPDSETTPIFKTINWINTDDDGNWIDYQDFDIYIYKESVFAEAVSKDDIKYTALDDKGNYNLEKAMKVWEHYTAE